MCLQTTRRSLNSVNWNRSKRALDLNSALVLETLLSVKFLSFPSIANNNSTKMKSTGSATTLDSKASNSNSQCSSSSGPQAQQRRYTRSTTVSVAQLLHDSCNSILQRFRRNPSEKPTTTGTRSSEKRRSSTNLR